MERLQGFLKALGIGLKPNWKVFFICFVIAVVFWFFQSMSRQYSTEINIDIEYANLPENKTFGKALPESFTAVVKGIGWDLMAYKFQFRDPTFSIDLKNLGDDKLYSSEAARDLIIKEVPGLTSILSIQPSSIDLTLEDALRIRVPIISRLNIICETGYGFNGAYPEPDSVTLFGQKQRMESIKEVFTVEQEVTDANTDLAITAALDLPEGTLESSVNEVVVRAVVESLTEQEIEATIKVKGYTGSRKLNIYPSVATLKLQTTMSQFEKVERSDFEVYIDYADILDNEQELLPVKVSNKSKFVQNYRVHPKYVNYFFEE